MTSRNIVELPDGTLLLGVSAQEINQGRLAYMWTSNDNGETWDQTTAEVKIGDYRGAAYDNIDGFFSNAFTFHVQGDKLLHFIRCGPPSPMYSLNDGRIVPSEGVCDRMMYCTSHDLGQTWSDVHDCGDYGMHFPRVIRLKDGRLLLTFTQRSVFRPLGLRAVLSHDEGETWEFQSETMLI